MKDADLVRMLYGIARHMPCANWQENQAIKEAADRLRYLTEKRPARVLDYHGILNTNNGTILWEECEIDGKSDIAPVEKYMGELRGNDCITIIRPDMCKGDWKFRMRWWTQKPTEEERRLTAWES